MEAGSVMQPLLSVVITTHGRASDLPIILGTLAHQRVNIEVPHSRDPSITCQWGLGDKSRIPYETIVCSDGPYGGPLAERELFGTLVETPKRHTEPNVGHHTRAPGIQAASGQWITLTNSDNLYVYGFLDMIAGHMMHHENGIVFWDLVNNLWRWGNYGGSKLKRGECDLSCVAVKAEIAKQVGFAWDHYDADADYVLACKERCEYLGLKIAKVNCTLSVHN